MIKIFRKIRQRLLIENKLNKYLLYAIGEIILVVIGILIALQVNNWNIAKADKTREVKYLKNIVLDLDKDLVSLDYLIEFRKARIMGDQEILKQINGATADDITTLTKNVANSLMEERFSPNNSAFTELANSGNLSLISNDSIKLLLLELNGIYKYNEFGIAHEEFDYREYISKPLFRYSEINKILPVFTGEKTIEEQNIMINDFDALFKSQEYKNGLYIFTTMHNAYIPIYESIKTKSQKIIDMIGEEIRE